MKIDELQRQVEQQYRTLAIFRRLAERRADVDMVVLEWPTERRPQLDISEIASRSDSSAVWWPTRFEPKGTLWPKPGYASASAEGHRTLVVAVPVFGIDRDHLERAVAQITGRQSQTKTLLPIFLTDMSDHALFRRAGVNFEYFPPAVYGGEAAIPLFQEKFLQAWRKWNVSIMIDMSAPGFLAPRIEDLELPQRPILESDRTFDPLLPAPEPRQPPTADIAALRAEYLAAGLDREPDSFVLYRIIGNDLHPRHRFGQAADNLRFILQNEPDLPACEKRWVVNRIVEPIQEATIIALLEQFGQAYIHIPFDLDEYRSVEWELESFPQPAFFIRGPYAELDSYERSRADAHVRRHKNNYVMNNNGARNVALRDGRGRAKWVLPWDGNCFVTAAAWAEIVDSVGASPFLKYFTVPMARCTDNSSLLDAGYRPATLDEPQLMFRKDAREEFDENFCYGRRPKVELFWRLGIPGEWDDWRDDVWDVGRAAWSEEAGAFGSAGWVARLSSGQEALEGPSRAGLKLRGVARNTAIVATTDALDDRAVRAIFKSESLVAYDEPAVSALAGAPQNSPLARLYDRLLLEADLAMGRGPYSVVHKTTLPPSGDPHDYWHPAPYWWPNPSTPDGRPYVYRDGERVPGTQLYEPESDRYDRTRLQRLFDDTTVLALAWLASGDSSYAGRAAELIRCWFVSPETRMNPHLSYAQVIVGQKDDEGTPSGIIEMKDLYFFLDALRLIKRSGALTETDDSQIRAWLTEYLDWLRTSDQGGAERRASNNHGTCYDLQVASIAAFLDDVPLLISTLRDSKERILEQFDSEGRQPQELARTLTQHYCCFNLQSWFNLATLAERCGTDLWRYAGADGRGIGTGLRWFLSRCSTEKWPHRQLSRFDRNRLRPLLVAAGAAGAGVAEESAYPLLHPHSGVKPFWMLGPDAGRADFSLLPEAAGKPLQINIPGPTRLTAQKLVRRLWSGFSRSAISDLEALKNATAVSSYQKTYAAWGLARWFHARGDYGRALANVALLKGDTAANDDTALAAILLESDCLTRLGRRDDARELLGQHLFGPFKARSSLALAMANTYVSNGDTGAGGSSAEQLAWINRVYESHDLNGLALADAGLPLSIDNLSCGPAGRTEAVAGRKVSVIFPAFNAAETIPLAIRSVLDQSWQDLEAIVVDDASTDNTFEIVKELAGGDERVKVIRLRENGGPYVARNAGLEIASGEFVTVHDADDWSHPEKIAAQLAEMNHGGLFSISHCARVSPQLYFEGRWRQQATLLSRNFSSLMLPTGLLRELGGWDRVRFGADAELIHRIGARFGDAAIKDTSPEIPYSFTLVRPESLTRTGLSHASTFAFGVRDDYRRSFQRWHASGASEAGYRLNRHGGSARAFPAPQAMLRGLANADPFDVVFVGDFSKDDIGVDEVAETIDLMAGHGLRVGIFQWPSYLTDEADEFADRVADLLDRFAIEQLSADQEAAAETVVLLDASLCSHPLDRCARISAGHALVLRRLPAIWDPDESGRQAEGLPTRDEVAALLGTDCRWRDWEPGRLRDIMPIGGLRRQGA